MKSKMLIYTLVWVMVLTGSVSLAHAGCPARNGNTCYGLGTLSSNTTGFDNTVVGADALRNNTTGSLNTAVGVDALFLNIGGSNNIAVGNALVNNTSGDNNIAVGGGALASNTTGAGNTAVGVNALAGSTGTGSDNNTAVGIDALRLTSGGQDNTALGAFALFQNTGDDNISIGKFAGSEHLGDSGNIDIGHMGVDGESDTIRIGTSQTATFIVGISGTTITSGDAVFISSAGRLATSVASSRRVKDDIRNMGAASSGLLRLQPVTFRYKQAEADGSRPLQYGLIAEEVAGVYPELVGYDAAGQPSSVRYHVLPTMLLNEFLKQWKQLEAQASQLAALQARLAVLEAALAAQGAPRHVVDGSRPFTMSQ